ncbi:hypothetical protein BGW38_001738, partial [Lunasporangiospora selenospora]
NESEGTTVLATTTVSAAKIDPLPTTEHDIQSSKTGKAASASESLRSIIRKSSNASLLSSSSLPASKEASAGPSTSAVANVAHQSGASLSGPAPETELNSHESTHTSDSSQQWAQPVDNSDSHSQTSVQTGQMSTLNVISAWWSGSSSTSVNIADIFNNGSPESVSTPKTIAVVPSATTAGQTSDQHCTAGWEPSDHGIISIRTIEADSPSPRSLPSSLPSSASFPESFPKHLKGAALAEGRKGRYSSSLHESLNIRILEKAAAAQDHTDSDSQSVDASQGEEPAGRLFISPLHAKVTDSSANSSKKRWSLFGFGARDSDAEEAANQGDNLAHHGQALRRQGNVLVEPEPDSETRTAPKIDDPSTLSSVESTRIVDGESQERPKGTDSPPPTIPAAAAVVSTSELSVTIPPGDSTLNEKVGSDSNTTGTTSSAYSWLSMIPGYGGKSDESGRPRTPSSIASEGTNTDMAVERSESLDSTKESKQGKQPTDKVSDQQNGKKKTNGSASPTVESENEGGNTVVRKAKEVGKAAAALSKVILKKKNIVLPNYYEVYPDLQQSLLRMPTSTTDGSAEHCGHERSSSSIMKSAVNALSSLLFRPAPALPLDSEQGEAANQQGTSAIRKVAIIGVHGWFPVKLIRTMIGEPTGTSKKFCDEMDLALRDYLKTHNVELNDEDITCIPLEGEGKVLKRVEILYQNLVRNERWRTAVHEADLVLVATHSQGTPTSTLLVSRLIDEGILRVHEDDPSMQRIGILAMAGISHGPFPFLKGNLIVRWFEAEAAHELFEFMDSESEIATKYRDALRNVLTSGVRFTCVASLEDQVVPLYSAIMTSVHHPSIVRAVYIDGSSFQDDFLTNLIAFALRLRNSGLDDNGVLVHLSEAVAGSIYGEGHSTIYEEREVYLLSIRALLEPPKNLTRELTQQEPIMHHFHARQTLNPFYLPWGMRGVMDELKAKGDEVLNVEMEKLKKLYDEWNPVSKAMKEIKFRLEPVRSKL